MTSVQVGLSITDREGDDWQRPTVQLQVTAHENDKAHVQVEATGFMPTAEGAYAVAEMLNDVASAIVAQLPPEMAAELGGVLTDEEMRARGPQAEDPAVIALAHARQEAIDTLVRTGITLEQAEAAVRRAPEMFNLVDPAHPQHIGDDGRVSFLAHEPQHTALTQPTPQRVLDARAARKAERAADKRAARFNPQPKKGGQR